MHDTVIMVAHISRGAVYTLEAHVNVLSLQVENKASKTLTFLKGQIEHEEFEKLKELFVLRDIIAHNHLWSAKVCVENFDFTLLETHLFEGFGDNKYLEVIDRDRRETKILNFPIFPTRISRRDVFVLLKTISEVLQTLCIKYPETYDLLNFDFSTNTDQVTLKNLHHKLRGVSL